MNIENKQAYHAAMAEIESYLAKGFAQLSESEEIRLDELSEAVAAWEEKTFPMPVNPTFIDILKWVLDVKRLKQTELANTLEISKGYLSSLLKGTKQPNLEVLKNLHKKFSLDGNLLLESIP